MELRVREGHKEVDFRLVVPTDYLRRLDGAVEAGGRLIVPDVDFFGMTAGSGEHYTMGRRVGNIGMTVGRSDIKY